MITIIEDYLDDEEKFYDYKTQTVNSSDIFDTSKTGMSYYDNFLNDKDLKYMEKTRELTGRIEQLTPQEYFEEVAKIFGTSVERQIQSAASDKTNIEHLKQVIQKYKRKFPLTYLNLANKQQEGRHRMYVAGELFGWDTKFPVLIVTEANKKNNTDN